MSKTENSPTHRLRGLAQSFARLLGEALFPPLCVGCRKELLPERASLSAGGAGLCKDCAHALSPQWQTICPVCEKERTFGSRVRCAHLPSPLKTVSYLLLYEHAPVRGAIRALKYRGVREALGPFTGIVEKERLNLLRIPADLIVPVPLHARKLRERGFNQSAIIAQMVGRLIEVTVREDVLARRQSAPAQMKVRNRKARARNVRGLFRVKDQADVRGRAVLVVDDVMTTGSTLNETARVLSAAGARAVHGFVLARD